jgi:hypothetical protein
MKRTLFIFGLLVVLAAGAAWAQPTATVLFKEQVDTETELEGIVGDTSDIFTNNDTNMVDFDHMIQGNTLAGNPGLAVDECFFAVTVGGGGFICEGSADDTNEMLFLFPDLNEADTTHVIVTESATQTLTNKSISGAQIDSGTIPADRVGAGHINVTTEIDGTMCGSGEILEDQGAAWACIATPAGGGAHNILSTTHTDSTTDTAARGDLIIADATPEWSALTVGGANTVLKSDGTDPSWGALIDDDIPDTLTASNYLLLAGGTMSGDITFAERSSDPSNPSEGQWVCWMSDGTGSGDDGDILCKVTAAAATKTWTMADFSAIP